MHKAREAPPRWGKAKLAIVLARTEIPLSVSAIGRILRYLRQRGVLREPQRVRATSHARHVRPHARRKPKGVPLAKELPGDLVEIDTMHLHLLPGVARCQFTVVDCASRWGVVGVRARATAGTAADFLAELLARFPFPVKAIQIDGGSEWMSVFEAACQEWGLPLQVLPPHSPKLNGQMERMNRTGREAGAPWAVWECYDGELDLPLVGEALRAWEAEYNMVRPHHALHLRTPAAFLADHLSKTS